MSELSERDQNLLKYTLITPLALVLVVVQIIGFLRKIMIFTDFHFDVAP